MSICVAGATRLWKVLAGALLPLVLLPGGTWQFRVERDEAYVAGATWESGLPASAGAVASQPAGQRCSPYGYGLRMVPCADGFFVRLRVADGSIDYATYLGGELYDAVRAVTSDADGNVYLVGETSSTDFPVTPDAAQEVYRGGHYTWYPGGAGHTGGDAFLVKLDPAGRLVYSTYLGGTGKDSASAVLVDSVGNIYLTGSTESEDFPVTADAYEPNYTPGPVGGNPRQNAFLASYDAAGRLSYATYFDGFAGTGSSALALDHTGDILVSGSFVARFRPAENRVVQYTEEAGGDMLAVDESGNYYLTGVAGPGLRTSPGAFQPSYRGGDSDAFLAGRNPDGSIRFATYLGGSWPDLPESLAVDEEGRVVVLGWSGSYNFPVSADAPHPCKQGTPNSADPVLARFDSSGRFLDGTYLAPSEGHIRSVTLDSRGRAWAIGSRDPLFVWTGLKLFARWQEAGLLEELEIDPPESTQVTCVASAASRIAGVISPGELLTIYGPGIGPEGEYGVSFDEEGKVRTSAGNVWVEVTGLSARRMPILYASRNQLNVVTPFDLNVVTPFDVLPGERVLVTLMDVLLGVPVFGGRVLVTVMKDGVPVGSVRTYVEATHPGIFSLDGTGGGQGAILNEDGTINSPTNPAAQESIVALYATGLGQTDPPGVDGAVYTGELPELRSPVSVKIGGRSADMLYAGPAPGMVAGVMQINVRLPQIGFGWPQFPVWIETGQESSFWATTLAIQ